MRNARCVALAVVVVLLVGGNGFAAGYLKFDGVDGESRDKGHKDQIDILAWSWGTGKAGNVGGGGCGGVERQSLVLTKFVDSTSSVFVRLAESCGTQAEAVFEVEIGADPSSNPPIRRVMRIRMREVVVTSVEMGSVDGDDVPTENLTLNSEEVEVEIVEVDRGR